MNKIRTCIFSGSFDPIHIGHAIVANYVSQTGVVDELWLMPSRVNPLKTDRPPADDCDRLEMCSIVASMCDNVMASDFEMMLPAPSFTYTTLTALREKYTDREFYLLIGSDNWLCFDRWRDYRKIIEEFGILIYPRPGFEVSKESLPHGVTLLTECPLVCLSSTFVRTRLADHADINFFVPDGVLKYIKQHNLYG